MDILSKESINSKELLKQINYFREIEYKEREANGILTNAQKKRGHYIELRHDNLLRTIRDEFNIKKDFLNFEEMLKLYTRNVKRLVLIRLKTQNKYY